MVSRVNIIGLGMGNPSLLTRDAAAALEGSELVIGSSRLLEALGETQARTVALVSPSAIAQELASAPERQASVVVSGDVGFYSGATALYEQLSQMELEVYPGISTLSYLCARLHRPWQDVYATSAHGRDCDVAGIVQTHRTSFFLLGGESSPATVCAELVSRGLAQVRVWVGERLSYEDERIICGSAADFVDKDFDALSAILVEYDHAHERGIASPWLPDEAFVRGSVPMTKEELRELAICKLRIRPDDVVWDVGSGTGSISVEAARAASAGQVFAIERDAEALALTRANCERFGLENVQIVEGEAPEALQGLAAPDRVFVGGSAGNLEQILRVALSANPALRLCVPSVTLETLSDCLRCVRELDLRKVDIVQVSVARACERGSYHLMRAENPIYLLLAEGPAADDAGEDAASTATSRDAEGR